MELTSYHQPEEFEKGQKERGDTSPYVLPTSQNPSCWNPSWLSHASATRKDPESEWLARDNQETNPITIKPETASHVAEQFSWVPLPCCSLPRRPFPMKSLALSARVSPWTIHFRVLDKSPLSGPGRGPPSCNKWWLWWGTFFATTDILATWGTQGPVRLLTDQTQRPQPGPFCPWSPSDTDDWPECPDQVRNKRLYWSLSPSLFLSSFQPLLSYPFFFCPGPGRRSLVEGPQPDLRVGAWSPPVGRELEFWSGMWYVVSVSGFW